MVGPVITPHMFVNARDAVAISAVASPAHKLSAFVRSLCILIPLKFGPPGGLAVWFEAIKGGRSGGVVRGHNGWERVVQRVRRVFPPAGKHFALPGSISYQRGVFLTAGHYFSLGVLLLKGRISP